MRNVYITLTCILNGELVLLKKKETVWELPKQELDNNTTSTEQSKKMMIEILEQQFEDITHNNIVIHDSILNSWRTTTKTDVIIHHGICILNSDTLTTKPDYYWTPLETVHKIVNKEDKTTIRLYNNIVNNHLEYQKIINSYREVS